MTALAPARPGLLARLFLAFLIVSGLGSCGSGAVSGPSTPANSGPLAITPSAATLYSESPFTFLVTGGTGVYLITSSDQLAIPAVGTLTGNSLTLVPGPVAVDTPVTINVRDSGTATPVSATVTVKPRTIANTITITPSASQSAACGSAVCSGGDAEVKVLLTQGGIPLVNREVRFNVVSGDFRIITSGPGEAEALSLSATANTDAAGFARIRVRVLADAGAQTALLDVTDISSGFTQRTSFTIAPSSNAPLNAQPSTIAFIGRDSSSCATGISADVIVFGGRPPYSISQPGTFVVSPTLVTSSGGRFTVTATGQCTSGSPIAVVDGTGSTVTVTATNSRPDFVNPPAFVVSPTTVTLETCNTVASVILAGGLGPGTYFGRSGNDAVTVSVPTGSNTATIRRRSGTVANPSGPVTTPVVVALSDGRSVEDVTVNLTGAGAGVCP